MQISKIYICYSSDVSTQAHARDGFNSEPLKTKQPQLRLLVGFAQGIVTGLLLQGQMAGLHTETYSPSRLTFYFLGAKVDIFNNTAIETKKSNI
jgi:hypothetical protein